VKEQSSAVPLDRNSQTFTECSREKGRAYGTPTCLRESEKGLLAGVVGTGDTVEINLDFSGRTALGDGLRQTICPFSDQLPVQDNLDPISQIEDRGS
jgi:hypothetical protein